MATVLQVEGQGNVVIFQTSSRQKTQEQTTTTEIGPNPYKGLSYFDEEDSGARRI